MAGTPFSFEGRTWTPRAIRSGADYYGTASAGYTFANDSKIRLTRTGTYSGGASPQVKVGYSVPVTVSDDGKIILTFTHQMSLIDPGGGWIEQLVPALLATDGITFVSATMTGSWHVDAGSGIDFVNMKQNETNTAVVTSFFSTEARTTTIWSGLTAGTSYLIFFGFWNQRPNVATADTSSAWDLTFIEGAGVRTTSILTDTFNNEIEFDSLVITKRLNQIGMAEVDFKVASGQSGWLNAYQNVELMYRNANSVVEFRGMVDEIAVSPDEHDIKFILKQRHFNIQRKETEKNFLISLGNVNDKSTIDSVSSTQIGDTTDDIDLSVSPTTDSTNAVLIVPGAVATSVVENASSLVTTANSNSGAIATLNTDDDTKMKFRSSSQSSFTVDITYTASSGRANVTGVLGFVKIQSGELIGTTTKTTFQLYNWTTAGYEDLEVTTDAGGINPLAVNSTKELTGKKQGNAYVESGTDSVKFRVLVEYGSSSTASYWIKYLKCEIFTDPTYDGTSFPITAKATNLLTVTGNPSTSGVAVGDTYVIGTDNATILAALLGEHPYGLFISNFSSTLTEYTASNWSISKPTTWDAFTFILKKEEAVMIYDDNNNFLDVIKRADLATIKTTGLTFSDASSTNKPKFLKVTRKGTTNYTKCVVRGATYKVYDTDVSIIGEAAIPGSEIGKTLRVTDSTILSVTEATKRAEGELALIRGEDPNTGIRNPTFRIEIDPDLDLIVGDVADVVHDGITYSDLPIQMIQISYTGINTKTVVIEIGWQSTPPSFQKTNRLNVIQREIRSLHQAMRDLPTAMAVTGGTVTSHTHNLADLTDTTITAAATDEVLKWSGTKWVDGERIDQDLRVADSPTFNFLTATSGIDIDGASGQLTVQGTSAFDWSLDAVADDTTGLTLGLKGVISAGTKDSIPLIFDSQVFSGSAKAQDAKIQMIADATDPYLSFSVAKSFADTTVTEAIRLFDDKLEILGLSITGTSVDINNAELQQLSLIGATTISAAQWAFLGAMDQGVAQADSPTFAGLTLNGNLNMGTNNILGTAGSWDVGGTSNELDNLFLGDSTGIKFGLDQDIHVFYNPAGGVVGLEIDDAAGAVMLNLNDSGAGSTAAANPYIRFEGNSTQLGFMGYGSGSTSDLNIFNNQAAEINFATSATIRWQINASGHLEPEVDKTYNIGSTSLGILNLYMGGTGTDDSKLELPYLTAAPGTLANGAIWTESDGIHTYLAGAEKILSTFEYEAVLHTYIDSKTRQAEWNIHGGLTLLSSGETVSSGSPTGSITNGISKVYIVVTAGADTAGDITITGTSVNRDSGAESGSDTDVLTIAGTTTDSSGTDSGGNVTHAFTDGYLSTKWFKGDVVVSTTDVNITFDIYAVSFEQFDDNANITVKTLDAKIYPTNAAANIYFHLYSIKPTSGSKADITKETSMELVAADVSADLPYRLRRGSLALAIDGTSEGCWIDVFPEPLANTYWDDISVALWFCLTKTLYT